MYYPELKLTSNAVQIILANTHMNVGIQLNIQLSQGTAATQVRGGGKYYSSFLYGSSGNIAVKELLKLAYICHKVIVKIKLVRFLWPTVYLHLLQSCLLWKTFAKWNYLQIQNSD